MAYLPQKNRDSMQLQFDSFNDLMLFIGLTRRLSQYPDCTVTLPQACRDPDLFTDIYSLLYLYSPSDLSEAVGVYTECVGHPERYENWVKRRFNLSVSLCRNIRVVNGVEEVEELITQNREIVASEIYLKPKYIEVLSIPRRVVEVVEQFQALMKEDIYGRLVQVCQFSYPSPVPLVRAIIDLYNEEWTTVFDENPYAFLKAIRESKMYRKESYTNRSYKRPHVSNVRLMKMNTIRE